MTDLVKRNSKAVESDDLEVDSSSEDEFKKHSDNIPSLVFNESGATVPTARRRSLSARSSNPRAPEALVMNTSISTASGNGRMIFTRSRTDELTENEKALWDALEDLRTEVDVLRKQMQNSTPTAGVEVVAKVFTSPKSTKARMSGTTGSAGLSSIDPKASRVLHVGWMHKRRNQLGSKWKRRWMVLKDDVLMYYSTPSEDSLKGTLKLTNTFNVSRQKSNANDKRVASDNDDLLLVAEGKSFLLRCDLPSELTMWYRYLKNRSGMHCLSFYLSISNFS
jgi:hypothetical protein